MTIKAQPILPGAMVYDPKDPDRLYLVTATSPWGLCVGNVWMSWEAVADWEAP